MSELNESNIVKLMISRYADPGNKFKRNHIQNECVKYYGDSYDIWISQVLTANGHASVLCLSKCKLFALNARPDTVGINLHKVIVPTTLFIRS